jgi:hypothetical protein
MLKNMLWFQGFLVIALFLASCLAAGQAITFAWISSFPEQASRLESLEIKFWGYAALSIALFVIDIFVILRVLKRFKSDHKTK